MTVTPTVLFDGVMILDTGSLYGGPFTITDHGNKLELAVKVTDEDRSAFGSEWTDSESGLKSGTVNATFMNDFEDNQLDENMWAMLGKKVGFTIKPTSDAVSATNPSYTGKLRINSWSPLSADVGKVTMVSVSFPTCGTVTRGTS